MAANALLAENQVQRYLMERRAAFAADAHYLQGMSLRKVAQACGKTTQTVRNWLEEYGPKQYLTIREERDKLTQGPPCFVLHLIKVETDDQLMKRKLREYRNDGRRIVPAARNLVDPRQPEGYAVGINVQVLWGQLAVS